MTTPFGYYCPANRHCLRQNPGFAVNFEPDDLFALAQFIPKELRELFTPPPSARSQTSRDDTVSSDKDKFQANLDVQQFRPDEITVKVTGDKAVTVECKHEEKADEHGFISRHFIRRYVLPDGHDIDKVESKLSSDGVLTISAPRLGKVDDESNERAIPITQTGAPLKPIEKKKEEE